MGTRNWQLVRDLEIAKQAGRPDEIARLDALVEASQQACKHPPECKQVAVVQKTVETTYRGTINGGDTVVWCLACSRFLRHMPKRS